MNSASPLRLRSGLLGVAGCRGRDLRMPWHRPQHPCSAHPHRRGRGGSGGRLGSVGLSSHARLSCRPPRVLSRVPWASLGLPGLGSLNRSAPLTPGS